MKLLIVSSSEKSIRDFNEVLSVNRYIELVSAGSISSAKEIIKRESVDIVLINSPLKDGDGVDFSYFLANSGLYQVIIIMQPSATADSFGAHGIYVIERPISANMFWTVIRLATATQARLGNLQRDNAKLKSNLENVKIVDRAKCLLIQYKAMSEENAHRYIEKQAMDKRKTKREVAEEIIMAYGTEEN